MPVDTAVAESFEAYLQHLRWLVDAPSQFTEPQDVERLMHNVQKRFEKFLPAYACSRDALGNLRCLPRSLAAGEPVLFCSAHVDTVPTDSARWAAPFQPRPHWENENEIVGQGVNDCKAGVAAQLWLAEIFGRRDALRNVVFTVTFKEEGAGQKTGVALGAAFGHSLPAPPPGSTLVVMENTVNVQRGIPLVYAAEASSYTVRISGSIAELQATLRRMKEWRPVAIAPCAAAPEYSFTDYPSLGHVCTAPPEENPLLQALRRAGPGEFLLSGDERSLGTVPARIGRASSPENNPPHRLTITKRGSYSLEETKAELGAMIYEPVKPLESSTGFDARDRGGESPVGRAFAEFARRGAVEFALNPGASDATIISAAMPAELRRNLLPLVCGPGSRAQREAAPPRFTHGPNETFVKEPGRACLELIVNVLRKAGHLHQED